MSRSLTKHATAAFESGLAAYDESRAWGQKYLHPPSETSPSYCGYPDNNNSPSVHMDIRQALTLKPHIATSDVKFTSLYLIAPGLLNMVFEARTLTNSNAWVCEKINPTSGVNDVMGQYNNAIDVPSIKYFSSIRENYGSTTFDLNTNTLTDSGMCTAASFRPNVFNFTSYSNFFDRYRNYANFKEISPHVKRIFDEEDEFEVVKTTSKSSHVLPPTPTPRVNLSSIQVVKLGRFINSEEDLTQLSPKSYSGVAKAGAFVRQFLSQPVNMYKDIGDQSAVDGATSLMYCAYEFINDAGVAFVNFFIYDRAADPAKPDRACLDLPWSDMRWTFVMFSNIDIASGLALKSLRGWEIQALNGSVLNTQSRNSCLPDAKLVESISAISHVAPDALEAQYNHKGSKACADETLRESGLEGEKVGANLGSEHLLAEKDINTVLGSGSTPKEGRPTKQKFKVTTQPPIQEERAAVNSKKTKSTAVNRNKPHIRNNTRKRRNPGSNGTTSKNVTPVKAKIKSGINKEQSLMKKLKKMILSS
jgi:hypothetical protein